MKNLRTLALTASVAALMGLGGCATSFDKAEVLRQFFPGEQPLYVVVPGKPKNLADIKDFSKFCGKQDLTDAIAPSLNTWTEKNVCPDLTKWQIVSGVYQTKVWGMQGLKFMGAYAPVEMKIEPDDILEFSLEISEQGQHTRPNLVKRIARKAKDATKESGCWWDGGKGATTAFKGGGAVCDGWNWRDQKFAKE
jgi:hypothetical protein